MSTWRLAQVDQILHWAEHGQLNVQQVARLEALEPLQPSRAAWLAAGTRFCTLAGALLLAAAVVFFFAYNWDGMHRFAKLALATGALAACGLMALASRPAGLAWQAALFGAALCTGALLALIGQIYQTGADIWELFAAWAVLMLPFVLLARSWPTWLLCLLASNLCVTRMMVPDGGLWQFGVQDEAVKLALWLALNTLWWLAAWRGGRWMLNASTPGRHLERISAALALTALTVGAVLGVWETHFVVYVPLFIAVAGAGFWYYRHQRLDIVMLGSLCVASVVVATSVLLRILGDDWRALSFILFVTAAFVLGATGYLAVWLKNLIRQQHQRDMAATDPRNADEVIDAKLVPRITTRINVVPHLLATFRAHDIADEAQCQRLANLAPGAAWLTALQALAAWLAALLLTGAFFVLDGPLLFFAVVLIAVGMALFWRQRDSAFMNQLALGLSMAGQLLLAFVWADESRDAHLFASAVLALALTIPRTSLLHRSLCMAMAVGCGLYSVPDRYFLDWAGWLGVVFVALATALWLARRHWVVCPQAGYVAALAHSASFIGLAIFLLAQHYVGDLFYDGKLTHYGFYQWAAPLVWLASAGWLLRALPRREQIVLAAAAVVVGALGYGAPAMLSCLTLTLATFYACQRDWLVRSVAGAWVFLGLFYYSLTQTLLIKSATLAAAGVALLALAWLIRYRLGEPSGEPSGEQA
ncbi:hypothetical protein AXE65_09255 [Ventosimonas gracilis]|uniref:DUF4401 domain-containing protein n=1 Tax=Ventosimonas gracilis TaxID=1680762 RepID=A0A139SXA3_9GAMM|nr:DUF4401 domain-containing protein [Ventosimonas gracilis]KXU39253.1 hypothetical protein AXE65_09255 [Ventosimonas gracilis]